MTFSDAGIVSVATALLTLFGKEVFGWIMDRISKKTNGNGKVNGNGLSIYLREELEEITAKSVRAELEKGVIPVLQDIRDGILRLVTIQEERSRLYGRDSSGN